MSDYSNSDRSSEETEEPLPFSRRGVLAASSLLGLGLVSSTGGVSAQSSDSDPGDDSPFALDDHDHSGDYLGEESPVDRIDVETVRADNVSTTRYADSIAEVNEYIKEAPSSVEMNEQSGVKIVLRQGTIEPDPEELPVELKSGVVIEGQGSKATSIDVRGIGKPVFKYDRAKQAVARHVTIRDLKVQGSWFDDDVDVAPGSKGVFLKNIHYWLIENCTFLGLDVGIDIPGSWTGLIENCHVDGCAEYGIRADFFDNSPRNGMEPNNIQIKDCEVKRTKRGEAQVGIYLASGKNALVSGTDVSGSGRYAVLAEDYEGVAIHGAYFENNGNNQDRDGDGRNEPVQIGLAPDGSSGRVIGASIIGNTIGHSAGDHSIGIKVNNVRGVHIAGNYLTGRRNKSLVELGPSMKKVHIGENGVLNNADRHVVAGPLDGSNVPPQELNDGVWRTSILGDYDEIQTLAKNYVAKNLQNGIDVVLTDSIDGGATVVDGANFPAGTRFTGVGMQSTTVESDSESAPAVALSRTAQALENVNVRTAGDTAVHVEQTAEKGVLTNVVCNGAIDVNGEGARVVGCDAPVDAADVSSVLDLSLDTGGLDPSTGSTTAYAIPNQTLTIDGDVSELAGTKGLTVEEDFEVFKSDPTVSGPLWLTWDQDYLYLAADLADDDHVQQYDGGETWKQDLIQAAIASGEPGDADAWDEMDIALTPDGPQVYRRVLPDGSPAEVLDSAKTEIVRTEGGTDGMAQLTVTQDSPNKWRRMSHEVTVNLDDSPYLSITVPESVGKWNVAVADGSSTAKLFTDSSNTGTFTANVAEKTGWSGEKTFTVRLYAVGYDEPVTVDSIGLYDSPNALTAAWEDEFTSLSSSWDVRSGLDVQIVTQEIPPHTTYEVAVPWSALTVSPSDDAVSVSLGIHDVDDGGDTNSGWVEWGGGIFGGKNSAEFNLATLQE